MRATKRRGKKTDHGAEYVVIVQRIPASIIPQLVVSIFSFIRTFLCFIGSPSSAAPEKKREERTKKEETYRVDLEVMQPDIR